MTKNQAGSATAITSVPSQACLLNLQSTNVMLGTAQFFRANSDLIMWSSDIGWQSVVRRGRTKSQICLEFGGFGEC